MGFNEDIDALALSDDEKTRLKRAHKAEVDPLSEELGKARSNSRKDSVKAEVMALSDAGLKDAPKALAFVRRVFLSPDAENPGVVLFSDTDLELSGDEMTGATSREEMSVAKAFRTFFSLLPHDADGKLKVMLSDQANVTEDDGRPKTGNEGDDAEARTTAHKESLGKSIGKPIGRPSRAKRYGGVGAGA